MTNDVVLFDPDEPVMDRWAADQLIEWAAGKASTNLTRESLRSQLEAQATALAGPDPTPVEQMLARTAAHAWMALRLSEGHQYGISCSSQGLTLKQAEFYQRRTERANRRLLATLRTLATVRKLGVPVVQINLARQQINLASAPDATPSDSIL